MKESTRNFLKRAARYFFIQHFFSTFWSIIGVILLITALCVLPKGLRILKTVRCETRQALVECRSALRETRKAIRDSYRAAEEVQKLNLYLRQPFQVNLQLRGESDWLDMKTTGNAVIAPQEKTAPPQEKPAAPQK